MMDVSMHVIKGATPLQVEDWVGINKWVMLENKEDHLLNSEGIALQGSSAQSVAVALGSESLVVAQLAVDVLVGGLATADRVQALVARAAFKALFVPSLSPRQHLFGLVYTASATGTALAVWGACNRAWLQHCAITDLTNPKPGKRAVVEEKRMLVSETSEDTYRGWMLCTDVWVNGTLISSLPGLVV